MKKLYGCIVYHNMRIVEVDGSFVFMFMSVKQFECVVTLVKNLKEVKVFAFQFLLVLKGFENGIKEHA